MLPPGHIAGGFLAAEALLKIAKPDLPASQLNQLLWWGAFFGFAPDLDYFITFAKEKALTVKDFQKNNHRKFPSHAPLLWLTVGLLVYLFASSIFTKYLGLMVWLGSWSHFAIDSLEYGVMWLWPFSKRKFYFKFQGEKNISATGFWRYWVEFVKTYAKTLSFYLEIALIIITLFIYFRV